ncbi:hypothetical protein C8N37_103317 [Sphingobacterium faecium]|nr:hypothetical protein C8N37_103317 [Sphingobacterium faecium]
MNFASYESSAPFMLMYLVGGFLLFGQSEGC